MRAKDALKLFAHKQWMQFKAAVTAETPEGAYELIKFAYSTCPLTTSLDGLVDSPDDLVGLTIFGAMQAGLGKRHRGSNVAEAVKEAQFQRYFDAMVESKSALEQALTINRRFGLAAAFYMLLSVDPIEDDQKDMAEARLLDAENVPLSGYMNLLNARTEKWGGSHDDMFRIARSRLRDEMPLQSILIARAHYERKLFYSHFDQSPQAEEMAEAYVQGAVLDDLKLASQSVLNAKEQDAAELRLAHSWMALILGMGEQPKLAVKHLDRLKGHEDPHVWGMAAIPPFALKALFRFQAMVA